MYDDDDDDDDVEDGVGLKEGGAEKTMSQEQVMEMLKMHERLLYTILATIGIPIVLIILFYIDVSLLFYVFVPYADDGYCDNGTLVVCYWRALGWTTATRTR